MKNNQVQLNERHLDKLDLFQYYNNKEVMSLLRKIARYKDINLQEFCGKYLKDKDATPVMVQCELVQYICDKALVLNQDALEACYNIVYTTDVVDELIDLVRAGLKIKDVVDYKDINYRVDDFTSADVRLSLGRYLGCSKQEICGLQVKEIDAEIYQLYYKGVALEGQFSQVVSVSLSEGIVSAVAANDNDVLLKEYDLEKNLLEDRYEEAEVDMELTGDTGGIL